MKDPRTLTLEAEDVRLLHRATALAVELYDGVEREGDGVPTDAPLYGKRDRLVELARQLDHEANCEGGIPVDYWRPVPCGHPPEPVAMYNPEGWPVCHCGCLLDTAGLLPAPPEAPGPLSHCQKCGCHVAIPPATEVPK